MKLTLQLLGLGALTGLTIAVTKVTWIPFLDDTNLIFHEAGHILFMFFGETLYTLGGSLFQIMLPLLLAAAFYKKNEVRSALIMTWWSGENMINVGRYIADARAQLLPLIGGDHDWAVLLSGHPKLLFYDTTMGYALQDFGVFVMLFSIALCAYFTLKIGITYRTDIK